MCLPCARPRMSWIAPRSLMTPLDLAAGPAASGWRIGCLAVDPVAGGAKIAAQAAAWRWPAFLLAEQVREAALEASLGWCLSPTGRDRARLCPAQAAAANSLAARIGAGLS